MLYHCIFRFPDFFFWTSVLDECKDKTNNFTLSTQLQYPNTPIYGYLASSTWPLVHWFLNIIFSCHFTSRENLTKGTGNILLSHLESFLNIMEKQYNKIDPWDDIARLCSHKNLVHSTAKCVDT